MGHLFFNCWIALQALAAPAGFGIGAGVIAALYVKATTEPFTRVPAAESEDYRRHADQAIAVTIPAQRTAGDLS